MNEENNTLRKWSAGSRPTTMFPADLAYCQRQQGGGFFSALNWFTPDRRLRRRWPGLGAVLTLCVIASCATVARGQEAPADPHHDVQKTPADPDVRDTLEAPDRAAKQLVVGAGQFGGPPRRLHLPGNGNDNLKSKLRNGPLTLHNGRLRPVATIERVDKDVQLEFDQASSNSNRNFPIRRGGPPMTKTRPSRPGPGNLRKPLPGPRRPSFFPQNNVPFSYNAKPVPEVYINDFSDTNDFREFQQSPGEDLAGDSAASASEVFNDWSTKVSQSKNGQQKVNLDTKYFSITYPSDDKQQMSTTSDPGLSYIAGKPGLVLRKVKGRKKTSTVATVTESQGPGVDSVDRIDIDTVASLQESETKIVDLCQNKALECATETGMNVTEVEEEPDTKASAGSILPTYDQLLKHFKKEFWVIPVLAAAGIMVLILVIFEIFLLSKTINKSPSRRHLFLGQMLLLGLLACASMATLVTLRPTPLTCAALRLGTGLAYSLVYSTLLVKLVFLISLNSGVYLPATYQSLLLCFALLIQLVIGVQWLVTSPPDVVDRPGGDSAEEAETMVFTCATQFKQQLLGLLYVVFLIIVVVILAFKSRGVRENYREAMYVGLTIGFTVSIWVIWIVAGLIVPHPYQDVSIACGLIACTAITFVIMFMPKGRQLSAMGREGVYAEDRTDVYTGDSGTGSTGSSGTPSPSFFPVKPHHKVNHNHGYHDDTKEFKERQRDRERLETPPMSHRNLQRQHHRHDDNIYTSLETLNDTNSNRYPFKSKPSRHNPNVLFRRPNEMPSGILY